MEKIYPKLAEMYSIIYEAFQNYARAKQFQSIVLEFAAKTSAENFVDKNICLKFCGISKRIVLSVAHPENLDIYS